MFFKHPFGKVLDGCFLIRALQYGVTPSMSRRASPYDMPWPKIFSILKSECSRIYKPETILEAQAFIDEYIAIYKNESLPLSTKRSPFEKRRLFAQFAVILLLAVLSVFSF